MTRLPHPVDGDEQISTSYFIWHVGQLLNVDMNEAARVVLERLLLGEFSGLICDQVAQVRAAMAAQVTTQASAPYVKIDELSRDSKLVVGRHQQRGVQGVWAMGQVFSAVAFRLIADGLLVNCRRFGGATATASAAALQVIAGRSRRHAGVDRGGRRRLLPAAGARLGRQVAP
jgi:hypothetical protein